MKAFTAAGCSFRVRFVIQLLPCKHQNHAVNQITTNTQGDWSRAIGRSIGGLILLGFWLSLLIVSIVASPAVTVAGQTLQSGAR